MVLRLLETQRPTSSTSSNTLRKLQEPPDLQRAHRRDPAALLPGTQVAGSQAWRDLHVLVPHVPPGRPGDHQAHHVQGF